MLVTQSSSDLSILGEKLKLIEDKVLAYCEIEEKKKIRDLLWIYKTTAKDPQSKLFLFHYKLLL